MRKLVVAMIALAMLSVLSLAQTKGGDIYGTVVLADGSKVPGVTITLTGDKTGKKTTISTDQGNFRFLSLAPGTYELKFELDGFKTVDRKEIDVSLGRSVSLTILMETSTLKEEVVVQGKIATIDTRKTQVGMNVTKEMVDSLPTARNPWTVLGTVPGVMMDRVDVGGADSGQQSNFFANGGDGNDTTWNVDGANITDPSAIGAAPSYLNINSYAELQVTAGSNDITAQTGGVQLNFVTKRSGNTTTGDFHLYVEDKSWEMKLDPTPYMTSRGLVVPGIDRLYQYGINLGGPIMKDKFWWFGSYANQDIHKRTETPGVLDETLLVSGYGKLNFQLGNTSGDFHASFDAKKKWGRTLLSAAQQDSDSRWNQDGPTKLFYGGLSHVMGELMINVKSVYTNGGFNLVPRGSSVDANGHEAGNDWVFSNNASYMSGSAYHYITKRKSLDVAMDGNYFLEGALGGDHEIKFGVDYFHATTTSQTLYPNQRILYTYPGSVGNYVGIYPNYKSDVYFNRISAYLQDTISFGKLTVALGFRYDKEQGGLNDFTQPYFTWMEPGSVHNGERLYADKISALNIKSMKSPASWDILSPRIALTYDITGDGKNVVKLAAGRYMSQSGNNLASNFIPGRYGYADWNDANKDGKITYSELGDLWYTEYFDKVDKTTSLNRVRYSDDYNTPILSELTLTFEKALMEDLALSLTGFYKKRTNLAWDANSRGEQQAQYKGYFMDGSIETQSNWAITQYVTINGKQVPVYEQKTTPTGRYFYNFKDSYYKYLGLQLVLNKKLSNHWMGNVSFTLQDFKRHLSSSDLVELNNFSFFDGGQVAPATTGSGLRDIWVSSRWMAKFSGMYQLPWGLNLTGFFQARDGNPQPQRWRVTTTQGTRYIYAIDEKAGDSRLPTFWMLNLGVEKTFKMSEKVNATIVLDWYNATNNQIELGRNLNLGSATSMKGTQWSNAGLFQFGVRVNF